MPSISIIIPVFNAEAFLHQCIDSVLTQTFTDYELILVDDGSKDGSGEICESYAHMDCRVLVIHQKNAGISAARNTGLEHAAGMFVLFMDDDDLIRTDCLERLFQLQTRTDADIVIGGRKKFFSAEIVEDYKSFEDNYEIINARDFFCIGQERRFVTGHLYNKDLINNNRFNTDVILGEDTIFNYSILIHNPDIRIALYKEAFYYWRIRKDSTFHSEGGNVAFFSVGEWCLNEYQKSIVPVERNTNSDLLLLDALKELMLFRSQGFLERITIRDCNKLIKKGVGYLLHDSRINFKNKACYSVLAGFPFSYSIYIWMRNNLRI